MLFRAGQIVKLDRPNLGGRRAWRFIVLSRGTLGSGYYSLYCFSTPSYRSQDLGTIMQMSGYSLVLVDDYNEI